MEWARWARSRQRREAALWLWLLLGASQRTGKPHLLPAPSPAAANLPSSLVRGGTTADVKYLRGRGCREKTLRTVRWAKRAVEAWHESQAGRSTHRTFRREDAENNTACTCLPARPCRPIQAPICCHPINTPCVRCIWAGLSQYTPSWRRLVLCRRVPCPDDGVPTRASSCSSAMSMLRGFSLQAYPPPPMHAPQKPIPAVRMQ